MRKADEFFLRNKPQFVIGAANINQIQPSNMIEFAFAGRSNVGKSSLINAITNSNIAITSKTPGRTKQLNFFVVNNMSLVDLPGYGFAKAGKKEVENWSNLIFQYLLGRVNLKRLFLLIDSRRGLMDNDLHVMKILDNSAVLYQIILTKTDKVSETDLKKLISRIESINVEHTALYKDVLTCSSEKKMGIQEIRELLYNLTFNVNW